MGKEDSNDKLLEHPYKSTPIRYSVFLSIALLCWLSRNLMASFQFSCFPITASSVISPTNKVEGFSWSNIKPTSYLNYTLCYGKFQCTRLDVPMDWNSTSANSSRIQIAVVRLPAQVPVTDPRYGGAVLINPGGPGGSGVETVLNMGERLRVLFDSDSTFDSSLEFSSSDAKYFDVISWDPRGVEHTTPHLKCFPDEFSLDVWNFQQQEDGFAGDSNIAISYLWARAKALLAMCSYKDELAKHINTPPVAADMAEILERHGEWREKKAQTWLMSKEGQVAILKRESSHPLSVESITKRAKWLKGEEKLLYFGGSYGSIVGATFSAMYPHRTHRVVIDGIADVKDYYQSAWMKNLQDADKVVHKFYQYCHLAGPGKCALNNGGAVASVLEIKSLLESTISSLKADPIAVPASMTRGPEIITYTDASQLIKEAVYSPIRGFKRVADLFADIVYSNGSAFADYKQQGRKLRCPVEQCREKGPYADSCQPSSSGSEVTTAVLCSDAPGALYRTKMEYEDYAATLYNQSKWLGSYWSGIAMKCAHWKGEAKWKITGDQIRGNTSHPLLLIGNTLDPVTPIYNAHAVAELFPGSVVLQQNSEGHVSLSSPSLCTAKYIRKYFQTGKLPKPETVCEPQELPLLGQNTDRVKALSAEDEVLLAAIEGLSSFIIGL